MSVLGSTSEINCGIKKATTWGTEVQVTGSSAIALFPSSLQLNDSFADFLSRDIGQGNFRTSQARLQEDCSFSMSFDTTYASNGVYALLAGFMGTESSPTETTVGQSDYSCTMDFASSVYGNFWTLAYSIETDRVRAVPAFKVVSVTYTHAVNGAGTWTFQCVGDRSIVSSLTTVGNLQGLTTYSYETATLGGTNHYARINTQSGAGLSLSDNFTGIGWTLTMTRPHQPLFGLRGENTKYTLEPRQNGPIDCALKVDFTEVDDASLDMLSHWTNATKLKAEFFFDGTQIASGVNRSLKIQFPYLQATGQGPTGHDWANNNSLLLPSLTYRALKASAAPTGMTGVTNLVRFTPIFETRSTKWFS